MQKFQNMEQELASEVDRLKSELTMSRLDKSKTNAVTEAGHARDELKRSQQKVKDLTEEHAALMQREQRHREVELERDRLDKETQNLRTEMRAMQTTLDAEQVKVLRVQGEQLVVPQAEEFTKLELAHRR